MDRARPFPDRGGSTGMSKGTTTPASGSGAAKPPASVIASCPLAASGVLVIDEIGLPIANTSVTVWIGANSFSTTTDSNGEICLDLPPGTAGRIEVTDFHEAATGDSTKTSSGRHFAAGGTGP